MAEVGDGSNTRVTVGDSSGAQQSGGHQCVCVWGGGAQQSGGQQCVFGGGHSSGEESRVSSVERAGQACTGLHDLSGRSLSWLVDP